MAMAKKAPSVRVATCERRNLLLISSNIIARSHGRHVLLARRQALAQLPTIVTTDEHDMGSPSELSRPGVFRLNIGVGKATFERLVGSMAEPDYAALDGVIPHPVYARQRWIAILNPSWPSFEDVVKPLVAEAHERLARPRRRQPG